MTTSLKRLPMQFKADPRKVITLYLDPGESGRLGRFARFTDELSTDQAEKLYATTAALFKHRHRYYDEALHHHAERGLQALGYTPEWPEIKNLVFGAYLTKEYAVEAAALFNPSIVPHPDQTGLADGETRFVMTLRSVGEGHISSVGFMEGIIDENHDILFTEQGPWRTQGETLRPKPGDDDHYDIVFDARVPLPERVLFPQAASESMGMEDLRMVRFEDGDTVNYLGTYTAYNGKQIRPKILETADFTHFAIRDLQGTQVDNKGMAYFPRKVGGRYAMLSRQGGEVLGMMYSDDYMTWNDRLPLQSPTKDYELVQIGNCGSPIETSEGWLMLTHHVGPLRRYTLGVTLLDLDHPEKIISQLNEPLMEPLESEREGYVPNVLYTCGWMQHGNSLLIPYAMSDVACGFATVDIHELLSRLSG